MYFIAAKRCKTTYLVLLFCHQNKNFVIWHHLNSFSFLQSLWSGFENPESHMQQDKLQLTPVNRESGSGLRLRLGAGFSLHYLQAGLIGLRWFEGHAAVQVLSSFVTVISACWLQQIENCVNRFSTFACVFELLDHVRKLFTVCSFKWD